MSAALSPGGYVRQGQRGASPPRSVNVQVAVRCRPLNERERSHGDRVALSCDEPRSEIVFAAPSAQQRKAAASVTSTTTAGPAFVNGKKTFTYDHVFGPGASQQDVYARVVEPIVDEVLQGYNCTVFAYGQTGTGKTHTMEGRRHDDMVAVSERRLPDNAGIIPRAVQHIFDHLRSLSDEHSVRVSHLELYNEQLTDLLGPDDEATGDSLRVYEDPAKGTFVQGLEDTIVRSEKEIFAVLDKSALKRKTAETLMNKYSSRSHSIFSITIHIKESTPDGVDLLKVGKLNLVDLAGSENVGRSGAVKGRAREAGNINQSLLTLGRVIKALVDRHPHIPYRDSKLTRLLQESLGGRNKTCIIATVTPGSNSSEETLSTLDYAYRAKSIKNRPTVNQMIAKHVLLKEYTEEISRLKRELDATREKNGVYLTPDEFARLQKTTSNQTTQISELEAEKEEMERRTEAMRVKLNNTVETLKRDQQILAETRNTLNVVTTELKDTKGRLAVTMQQRDENAHLVRSHVTSEKVLFDEGTQLQGTLKTALSHVGLLQDRVAAKAALERENIASLDNLKHSVSTRVQSLCDQLQERFVEHEEAAKQTQLHLDNASEAIEAGLKTMGNDSDDFSERMNAEIAKAATVAEADAEALRICTESAIEQCDVALDGHSKQSMATEEAVANRCDILVQAFTSAKENLAQLRTLLAAQNTQQDQAFISFKATQAESASALKKEVDSAVAQQKEFVIALLKSAKNRRAEHAAAIAAVRQDMLADITRRMDGLLSEVSTRADAAHQQEVKFSDGLSQSGAAISTAVNNASATMESATGAMQQSHNAARDHLTERTSALAVTHDGTMDKGIAASNDVGKSLSALSSDFSAAKNSVQVAVRSVSDAVSTERRERRERAEAQALEMDQARAEFNGKVKDGAQGIRESVSQQKGGVGHVLQEEHKRVEAFQESISQSVKTGLEGEVVGLCIAVDEQAGLAPSRRAWDVVSRLTRTRPHGALIRELRKEEGLGKVDIGEFGQEVADDEEEEEVDNDVVVDGTDAGDREDQESSSKQQRNGETDAVSSSYELEDAGNDDDAESKLGNENMKEWDTSSATDNANVDRKGRESGDEEAEKVERVALADSTNTRLISRGSKPKIHPVIKKPVSGVSGTGASKASKSNIPAPRTRYGTRSRLGGGGS